MNTAFDIERLDAEIVELAFEAPLVTGSARYEHRQIVVIRAHVAFGEHRVVGFGEAAPLAGWSAETAEGCARLVRDFPSGVGLASIRALDAAFASLDGRPALRFGVELALLDALARYRQVPICRILAAERGRMPLASVPVQRTLGACTTDEARQHATKALQDGFGCLKMKVGAASIAADLDRIRQVHRACPEMTLRIDANGAWSLADACRVLESLAAGTLDLVEQPVSPAEFDRFLEEAADLGVDIAPDESCAPADNARRLIDSGRVRAVVLKPSAIGGLLPTADLIDRALRRDVRVILSTLIESAIGRSGVAHLAAAYPDVAGPHGLATGAWLTEDVAHSPDIIRDGFLAVRHGPGIGFEPAVADSARRSS